MSFIGQMGKGSKRLVDEVIPWVCNRNQFQRRKAVYMSRG